MTSTLLNKTTKHAAVLFGYGHEDKDMRHFCTSSNFSLKWFFTMKTWFTCALTSFDYDPWPNYFKEKQKPVLLDL